MVGSTEAIIQAAYQWASTQHNPYLEEIKKEYLRYKVVDHKFGKKCGCEYCQVLDEISGYLRSIRIGNHRGWNCFSFPMAEYYRRLEEAKQRKSLLKKKISTFIYKHNTNEKE